MMDERAVVRKENVISLHVVWWGCSCLFPVPRLLVLQYNRGQGTIVDSGTTDTYLPRAASDAFSRAFRTATGKFYSSNSMTMSQAEFEKLPDIVFVFDDGIEMPMHWSSYIECSERGVSE